MKHHLIALALILLVSSCNLFRKNTVSQVGKHNLKVHNAAALGDTLQKNRFEFEYLSFRGSGPLEMSDMRQNVNLNVRMQRHEKVWISVTAIFGIEAARMYVTKDSVFVVQKLPDYNYRAYSLDSLSQFTPVPMTVTRFQDFLLGNPLGDYQPARSGMENDTIWIEQMIGNVMLRELIHPEYVKIGQLNAYENKQQSSAEVEYGDFQQVGTNYLPNKVSILVSSPEINAKIKLNYSNFSLEEISDFPFRKP